ncbi:hypothetical protein [Rhodococcus aetherivorans]|uniref:hypothetical protein n=1 Tax=Rhodococcus aetherivorans TaxID=191292 RepID=UPI0002D230F3|nr:hypothetical protein [Rhodococcus aetherivorans]CCW09872.1 hypothetical protein EBESD8_4000 [Rhodococcus aetherivorans]
MSDNRFPVLDYDRSADGYYGNGREVLRESKIEPSVDESGLWVTLPIRSIIDNNNGSGFEIGPYSLLPCDVVELFNLLLEHIKRFPLDYQPTKGGAS